MELELIRQISQYGLLGIIAAAALFGVVQLWRDLKASWEQRILDNKQIVEVIDASNQTYAAMAASTEARARAIEAMSRAQEVTIQSLNAQHEILRRLDERNTGLLRNLDQIIVLSDKLREDVARMEQRVIEEARRIGGGQ